MITLASGARELIIWRQRAKHQQITNLIFRVYHESQDSNKFSRCYRIKIVAIAFAQVQVNYVVKGSKGQSTKITLATDFQHQYTDCVCNTLHFRVYALYITISTYILSIRDPWTETGQSWTETMRNLKPDQDQKYLTISDQLSPVGSLDPCFFIKNFLYNII